jgi:hypothetical protein
MHQRRIQKVSTCRHPTRISDHLGSAKPESAQLDGAGRELHSADVRLGPRRRVIEARPGECTRTVIEAVAIKVFQRIGKLLYKKILGLKPVEVKVEVAQVFPW